MKFLFLTLFSLGLLIQLIDCEENDTFPYLLGTFYGKGDQWNMHMSPKFDFISKITENMDEIDDMFGPFFKDFVYMGMRVDLINKIPTYHVCANYRTRVILQYNLIDEAVKERDDIVELSWKCATEIAFKLPYENDKTLESSVLNWSRNQPDETHLNRVQNALDEMKTKYTEFRQVFDTEINAAKELFDNINGDIYESNTIIGELLEGPDFSVFGLENLIRLTGQVSTNRDRLIRRLKIISNTLKDYNEQRIKWAEFIIGMRETLSSERKPVEMDARARYSYRV